jgi:hypothetical protein
LSPFLNSDSETVLLNPFPLFHHPTLVDVEASSSCFNFFTYKIILKENIIKYIQFKIHAGKACYLDKVGQVVQHDLTQAG